MVDLYFVDLTHSSHILFRFISLTSFAASCFLSTDNNSLSFAPVFEGDLGFSVLLDCIEAGDVDVSKSSGVEEELSLMCDILSSPVGDDFENLTLMDKDKGKRNYTT